MATLLERFTAKYIPEPNSGCWLWIGTTLSQGYGQMEFTLEPRGKQVAKLAHRIAYELFKGPIPGGLQIDHKCRVRCCVNPDHLEAVTPGENILRGLLGKLKIRPTHCLHGHENTPENTVVVRKKNGRTAKICRTCKMKSARAISRAKRIERIIQRASA